MPSHTGAPWGNFYLTFDYSCELLKYSLRLMHPQLGMENYRQLSGAMRYISSNFFLDSDLSSSSLIFSRVSFFAQLARELGHLSRIVLETLS